MEKSFHQIWTFYFATIRSAVTTHFPITWYRIHQRESTTWTSVSV